MSLRLRVTDLIAAARAQQEDGLADLLLQWLHPNGTSMPPTPSPAAADLHGLVATLQPRKRLADLVLPEVVRQACEEVLEEHQQADLLRAHRLEPRHRILLSGLPGNGKTSLAEAIAEGLGVPFLVVLYTGVIGQSLSATMERLRHLFDYVKARRCVLFYDEFDTIGKERGDPHDTDTLKRAVGSLLVAIDAVPSSVVLIVATNHLELLDRAVWRRFQVRLSLPKPDYAQVQEWCTRLQQQRGVPLSPGLIEMLADRLDGSSFAELEEVGNDILRRWVLAGGAGDIEAIVNDRLDQRTKRFVSAY